MAEGYLKSIDSGLEVYSAGTKPAAKVNPYAVKVMEETGIDISSGTPELVDKYTHLPFDYVITVCDNAKAACPVFTGKVANRLHIGFDDPADAVGTEEEILSVYRRVRDEIQDSFYKFYTTIKGHKMNNKSFGFIGGGRVDRILLNALMNRNSMPANVIISDTNNDVLQSLKNQFPAITAIQSNLEPAACDYVFISLHPPVMASTLEEIKNRIKKDAIVISLAPKLTIEKISSLLGGFTRIVRMIPNAPSYINEGFNPVVFSSTISPEEKSELFDLFSHFGKCPEVNEADLEAFAIVTAMGPTYLWFQLNQLYELGFLSEYRIKN